jgi:hypothetical protein
MPDTLCIVRGMQTDLYPLRHTHPTARLLAGLIGFGLLLIGIAAQFA